MSNLLLNSLYIYIAGMIIIGLPLYLIISKPENNDYNIPKVYLFPLLVWFWPIWIVLTCIWFLKAYKVTACYLRFQALVHFLPQLERKRWEDSYVRYIKLRFLFFIFVLEFELKPVKKG